MKVGSFMLMHEIWLAKALSDLKLAKLSVWDEILAEEVVDAAILSHSTML